MALSIWVILMSILEASSGTVVKCLGAKLDARLECTWLMRITDQSPRREKYGSKWMGWHSSKIDSLLPSIHVCPCHIILLWYVDKPRGLLHHDLADCGRYDYFPRTLCKIGILARVGGRLNQNFPRRMVKLWVTFKFNTIHVNPIQTSVIYSPAFPCSQHIDPVSNQVLVHSLHLICCITSAFVILSIQKAPSHLFTVDIHCQTQWYYHKVWSKNDNPYSYKESMQNPHNGAVFPVKIFLKVMFEVVTA